MTSTAREGPHPIQPLLPSLHTLQEAYPQFVRWSTVALVPVRPTPPESAALAHRRSVYAPRCAPSAPRRSADAVVPVRSSSQLRPRRSSVALVPVRPTSPKSAALAHRRSVCASCSNCGASSIQFLSNCLHGATQPTTARERSCAGCTFES